MSLPDEFVRMQPSIRSIMQARTEMEEDRALMGGSGLFEGEGWPGNLGEMGLVTWLQRHGLDAERAGRVNDLADVNVNGITIGVKTRSPAARSLPTLLFVPEKHVSKEWDWWFFCAWLDPALWLLGAVPIRVFRRYAEQHPRGFGRRDVPCRTMRTSDPRVVSPQRFLVQLRKGVRQTDPAD